MQSRISRIQSGISVWSARGFVLLLALVSALVAVLGFVGASVASAAQLVGTFRITAGSNTSSGEAGSYFRMVEPGGNLSGGPFLANPSSSATDTTYTLLSPGTDGGLVTGGYQPEPSPAFGVSGNSLAARIIHPTRSPA